MKSIQTPRAKTAPRDNVPLFAADISTFCKTLRGQLDSAGHAPPSHVALLNMLARSAGFRNFQALKANPTPQPATVAPPEAAPVPIVLPRDTNATPQLRKLLACFDTDGRLTRMPLKFAAQQLALWAMWVRFPAQREMNERDVNEILNRFHTFGDPATLRREMVTAGMLWRTQDCSRYRKEPAKPTPEAKQFLEILFAAVERAKQ